MKRRIGWSHKTAYGLFLSVAAAVLGLGFAGYCIVFLLVAYHRASYAPAPPSHPAVAGETVVVPGANIGAVPDAASLNALTGALKAQAPDLPWARMLVRHETHAAPVPIRSIFFPTGNMNEAIAICVKLASVGPGCTPMLSSSADLTWADGKAVRAAEFVKRGIVPFTGEAAAPALPLPTRSVRIRQQGVRIWLSPSYKPGDARLIDFVAAGDVMMGSPGTGLNPDIAPKADAAYLIGGDLAATFRRADIAFANLEGPLYDGPNPSAKDCANCFSFHSPVYYADVLSSLGVDAVSLANNHSGDYGEAGRASTMAALQARGIGFAGLDRDGARFATIALPGGRKAALVAFAPNNGTLNLNDIPAAEKLIRELKKTHNLVLVSFHGGAEGWAAVHIPDGSEIFQGEDRGDVKRFAHAAIDAGADIVVGQGPHVPRAVELYRGHLIAYSLGNFWTYTGVMNYAASGLGPVLEAWLAPDGGIAGFTIHSTRQAGRGVPRLDPEDEAARYVLYLTGTDFPETNADVTSAQSHGSK